MDLMPEAAFLSSKRFPLQVVFIDVVASCNKNVPQGLKPSRAKRDAARLKPCPSSRVYPQPVKAVAELSGSEVCLQPSDAKNQLWSPCFGGT
jgi:hypothetical protein